MTAVAYRVKFSNVVLFCKNALLSVGAKPEHGEALGVLLASADYRGHFSHGLNRLEMYIKDIKSGTTSASDEPCIVKETAATALVDGRNCLGVVVGNFAIQLAIQKAQHCGIGWVVAKGSNHYGIAAYYAMQAMKKGLLGFTGTNTSPLVYPTRSKQVGIGTNPLCLAAPAMDRKHDFVLDMATSTAALGKIEMHRRQCKKLPLSWSASSDGKATDDPVAALQGGLLPLGGEEHTGGYKGFGLGMLVEILCGICGDSNYGPNIRRWGSTGEVANLGQFFIALDPNSFADGFSQRMNDFSEQMQNLKRADDKVPILTPGQPERIHETECDNYGIPYPIVLIEAMKEVAENSGIAPLLVEA